MKLTDAQRELLEDKFVLWERASREGPMDMREYNGRAAQALKVALAIVSEAAAAEVALAACQARVRELEEALRDAVADELGDNWRSRARALLQPKEL